MALLQIVGARLTGVAACVPQGSEENSDYERFAPGEAQRVSAVTGIERRHLCNDRTTSADLCFAAACRLMEALHWRPSEVEALLFVSQTRDYLLPPTSCLLQQRLGLGQECLTLDISSGCTGWVYGLQMAAALIAAGSLKKVLLLVGDTPSKYKSRRDKTAWPLFGDAGSASALIYDDSSRPMCFHLATDGASAGAIMVPEGGSRHPFDAHSLVYERGADGIERTGLQSTMDGLTVMSFALLQAPLSLQRLAAHFHLALTEADALFLHQANRYLNERVCRKLHLRPEMVPSSLRDFGNTGSASIPLTMVTGELHDRLRTDTMRNYACAFGVGLTWGSVYFETRQLVCPPLVVL